MCTSGDGIYFKPRLDYDKQCLLVIIGAGEAGHKNIVAVSDGDRESEQSWLGGLASLRGADAHGKAWLANPLDDAPLPVPMRSRTRSARSASCSATSSAGERSLACTNAIENALGTVRLVQRNVKRWRNAEMALRWTAAGLLEAKKTFRRLKAYRQLPVLDAVLRRVVEKAKDQGPLDEINDAA